MIKSSNVSLVMSQSYMFRAYMNIKMLNINENSSIEQ